VRPLIGRISDRLKGAPFAAATLGVLLVALPVNAGTAGVSRQIAAVGTGSPTTGAFDPSGLNDATFVEFPAQMDTEEGPGPYPGVITNRRLSRGHGQGESAPSCRRDDSDPEFITGFEGLNHYQQRYARGGNQFSVEPPDQGLCAGNGYVMEVVNDVLNVYDATGHSVLPDNTASNVVSGFPRNVDHAIDLNSFFGYAPAINRSTGVRAQFVTDPSCLYDSATRRWFVVVLTLETFPNGAFTHVNHLDIAVSKTSNPTGAWTIYKVDVTNDGTNTGGQNPGPYLGDYPHIGADANGFYITTNAYPWCCNGFSGAQIYAFSKAQLAAGAATVNMVHLDTSGLVPVSSDSGPTQPGFTVWPAESPGQDFSNHRGGTEYFLSSNAADEATHPVTGTGGNHMSRQIILWTLSNTSSLNTSTPALDLDTEVLTVNRYAVPPKFRQPGSGSPPGTDVPQGHCINDTSTSTIAGTGCWKLLFAGEPAHDEVVSTPDSNDTRMQKVMYAKGKVWGALDTAINPDGGPQRAGIAWYIVEPHAGKIVHQGYLGAAGHDFTYPSIGVTAKGRGVLSFTASGDHLNPSAAFAGIDHSGVGDWRVVRGGRGPAPDDGFTSYKSQVGNPPRTRWGDYGATAVDGERVWIASEHIASECNYTEWGGPFFVGGTGDNLLGTCAGTPGGVGKRTALANWATRISLLEP
jgi:hypothetical protein